MSSEDIMKIKPHNTDSKYNRQIVFTSLNTYNDTHFLVHFAHV